MSNLSKSSYLLCFRAFWQCICLKIFPGFSVGLYRFPPEGSLPSNLKQPIPNSISRSPSSHHPTNSSRPFVSNLWSPMGCEPSENTVSVSVGQQIQDHTFSGLSIGKCCHTDGMHKCPRPGRSGGPGLGNKGLFGSFSCSQASRVPEHKYSCFSI